MRTIAIKIFLSLAVLFLAASCSDMIAPSAGQGSGGNVLIRIGEEVTAKTIVPSVTVNEFDRFQLEFFHKTEGTDPNEEPVYVISNLTPLQVRTGVSVTLEAGITWRVLAKAYITSLSIDIAHPAAISSGEDTVYIFGDETDKPVVLNLTLGVNDEDGATGWLSWEADFLNLYSTDAAYTAFLMIYEPGSVEAPKVIDLLNPNTDEHIGLPFVTIKTDRQGVDIARLELPRGRYRMAIDVSGNGPASYGLSELVRIFSNIETRLPFKTEDILGYKALSGDIAVAYNNLGSGNTSLMSTLARVRLSAVEVTNASDPRTYSTQEIISASALSSGTTWKLWVPIGVESAKIKIEFMSNATTVIRTDTRIITGIGARGKDNIKLSYNATRRTISSASGTPSYNTTNGNISFTGTFAGNSIAFYTTPTPSSLNPAITSNGLVINNNTSSPNVTQAYGSVFQGLTLEMRVTYSATHVLDRLILTIGTGATAYQIDVLEKYEGNATMPSYFAVLETAGNITVNAAFRSADSIAKIVCFGDSITFGQGDGNWEGADGNYDLTYPGILQTKLNSNSVEVINAGFPGYRTNDGADIFDEQVLWHNPSHAIIFFGINDVLQEYVNRAPPDSTFANTKFYLNEMVRKLYDGKRVIVVVKFLTGPMLETLLRAANVPEDRRKEVIAKYDELYDPANGSLRRAYPDQTKLIIINDVWNTPEATGIGGGNVWGAGVTWDYGRHGVHPNVSGYAVMANNIWFRIRDYISAAWKL